MAKFGFHKSAAYLALLTDFGESDSYVGAIKGVIHSICSDAKVIDITHHIEPQDVTAASFCLKAAYKYFPAGTVFVCVVDPGVGTERDIICMKSDGYVFLAPDNGLLSVLGNEAKVEVIRTVENQELWLKSVSKTFHGRDIFAPVAAHIANGHDISSIGPVRSQIQELSLPHPIKTTSGVLKGEVIYVDEFGNLITNIGEATLQTNMPGELSRIRISVSDKIEIKGIAKSYGSVAEGELVALVGSSGYLEIAQNGASACNTLGYGRSTEVVVKTD